MAATAYSTREGQRFAGDANLTVVTCCSCHVTYAIPTSFYRAALEWRGDRADGRGWSIFCPFGHKWHYTGETDTERLKRNLQEERNHRARLVAERDQAKADAKAQKAAKTRFKNQRDSMATRAAAGVCPAPGCGRTFKQLARHMASQHPEFNHDHGGES